MKFLLIIPLLCSCLVVFNGCGENDGMEKTGEDAEIEGVWSLVDATQGGQKILAVNNAVGFFLGAGLARTMDGGATWDFGFGAQLHNERQVEIRDVEFLGQTGWAVGVKNQQTRGVLKTKDGGRTWYDPSLGVPPPNAPSFIAVGFRDSLVGWAADNRGTVCITFDGGANWLLAPRIPQFGKLIFADAQNGWLLTASGGVDYERHVAGGEPYDQIFRSTDGGRTWSQVILSPPGRIRDMEFLDPQNGWLVGEAGRIYRTTDGGTTFQLQEKGSNTIHDIEFVDATNGWIVGSAGLILRTTDGGRTFRQEPSPITAHLLSLAFFDLQNGWAVGKESLAPGQTKGVMLRYQKR